MNISQSPPVVASQATTRNYLTPGTDTLNAAAQQASQAQAVGSPQSQPLQESSGTFSHEDSGRKAGEQVSFTEQQFEKLQSELAMTDLSAKDRFSEANAALEFLSKMGADPFGSSVEDVYGAF